MSFYRDPTFWTTSDHASSGYNTPDRERTIAVDGETRKLKVPQGAHLGSYEQPIRVRKEGNRFITMVNGAGVVVYYTITAGAGDCDPNSPYALYRKLKARSFGWFPLADCPVALLRTGMIAKEHIAAAELLDAQPCQHGTHSLDKPCPHAIAERDARAARQRAKTDAIISAHESADEKLVKAQQAQTAMLLASQQAQTVAIVAGIRELVPDARPIDPPPAPRKPKPDESK